MMHKIELLFGLAVIAISAVVVFCEDGKVEEIYVPGNKAVVEHNGRVSGREQERQNKAKEEEAQHRKEQGVPTVESEGEILELYEFYMTFLKRCSRTGNITSIPKRLQKFMMLSEKKVSWHCKYCRFRPDMHGNVYFREDSNHLSEEDVAAKCRQLHAERGEKSGGRQKRSYIYAYAGIWDKCIIPYKKDPGLPTDRADQLDRTHAIWEKYTGFRFVEYDGDNAQHGLNHNNYLNYINSNGCWSYVGNLRGNGQQISPCLGEGTQVHEIGHALGFNHEQKHPKSLDFVTVFYNNIEPSYRSQYYRDSWSSVFNRDNFFDISSTMHYPNWGFQVNNGLTMIANDPDLDYMVGYDNYFYLFRDIQPYHSCFDNFPTCDPLPVCENGGYPTVLEGVCACRCPEGLDSATSCWTPVVPDAPPSDWPDNTFTLLKTNEGDCPSGFSEGRISYMNPEWAWQGGSLHSPGYVNGYEWHHDACTQATPSGAGYEWPKGEYCILRFGGTCPSGFSEGLLEMYGNTPPAGNTGTLPDGEHGRLQQYQFCCRADGSHSEKIALPTTDPFILYRSNYWGCQAVEGMITTGEYYHLKGDLAAKSDTVFNGSLPYHYAWNLGMVNTYYCVYTPTSSPECGSVKVFTTETSYKFTTPSYPSDYPVGTECMWHFQSPPGTTMMIDFEDFEIPEEVDGCSGWVELKTYYPGMPGYRYCGSKNLRTRWTYENYLTVKLIGGRFANKGFNATVSVIKAEDMCYNGNGQDGSYASTLNYTKYYNPCLPWSDVQHCLYDQFDARMVDIDLTHNFCRNVGTGQMPWCYVDAEICRRENCDACTTGRCYDMADDCAWRVSQDPGYCDKNEMGEAYRLCMDTCGRCNSHTPMNAVKDVTCGTPADVTCISPSPFKNSYAVGEVASYKCPYSNDVRTRTCTGDGTWTVLNIVCNACPSGWTVYKQRCFKWLGWDTLLNHPDAEDACNAIGGGLPKVNTSDINMLMNELADIDVYDDGRVWLGMTEQNGSWLWDDGEPVTWEAWDSSEPYNYRGDCAISSSSEWSVASCDTTQVQVICEHFISETAVCADNLPNCMELLEKMPDMCFAQPDYAWQNCRHTCAVGECDFPVVCSDESIAGDGQRLTTESVINQGMHIEYECNTGSFLTAGNLKRACLPSGRLTGEQPVCSPPEETGRLGLFSDRVLRPRSSVYTNRAQILPDRDTMSIPVDGNITEWIFYSSFDDTVSLQIWRPTGSSTRFTLVGQNVVSQTEEDGKMIVRIPESDQIQARAGDLVGFISTGSIRYTRCDSNYMPENADWLNSNDGVAQNTEAGTEFQFQSAYYDCRIYSIRVTMSPRNYD